MVFLCSVFLASCAHTHSYTYIIRVAFRLVYMVFPFWLFTIFFLSRSLRMCRQVSAFHVLFCYFLSTFYSEHKVILQANFNCLLFLLLLFSLLHFLRLCCKMSISSRARETSSRVVPLYVRSCKDTLCTQPHKFECEKAMGKKFFVLIDKILCAIHSDWCKMCVCNAMFTNANSCADSLWLVGKSLHLNLVVSSCCRRTSCVWALYKKMGGGQKLGCQ